jgi:hypothetical protein
MSDFIGGLTLWPEDEKAGEKLTAREYKDGFDVTVGGNYITLTEEQAEDLGNFLLKRGE